MTRRILVVALALTFLGGWTSNVTAARTATTNSASLNGTNSSPAAAATPGVKAAEALSTITGVAISPLLGVSAVGAWKYWKADPDDRPNLPWFAQPWFWLPGLLLVGLVFLKDVGGTAMPTALKKPFDVAELFENKISGLVAAGAFVPIIASVFGSNCGCGSESMTSQLGLAMFHPTDALNFIVVPLAVAAFIVVWLVAHVIHVLILLSPFGTIDVILKSARLFLLTTVAATAMANPYFGAAVALVIIVIAWFLAGWSMRLLVFGNIFAWDLFTLRCRRFKPVETGVRAFTARRIEKVPVRTCGTVRRDAQGRLVLDHRPWFILPSRTLLLPEGDYSVGRGLLNPEVLHLKDGAARPLLTLPPRCLTHEEDVAKMYQLAGVQDVGMMRGMKTLWGWLKGLFASGPKTVSAPA